MPNPKKRLLVTFLDLISIKVSFVKKAEGVVCLCMGIKMLTYPSKTVFQQYFMLTDLCFLAFFCLIGRRQHAEFCLKIAGKIFGIVET